MCAIYTKYTPTIGSALKENGEWKIPTAPTHTATCTTSNQSHFPRCLAMARTPDVPCVAFHSSLFSLSNLYSGPEQHNNYRGCGPMSHLACSARSHTLSSTNPSLARERASRPDSRTAPEKNGKQLNQVQISFADLTVVLWGRSVAGVAALRAHRINAPRVARLHRLALLLLVDPLAARGSGLSICAVTHAGRIAGAHRGEAVVLCCGMENHREFGLKKLPGSFDGAKSKTLGFEIIAK